MLNQAEIKSWIDAFLEGTDRFVVDISVKNGDTIFVFLDADTSLTIDHCVEVSRMIESRLDREELDFELRVSSAGIDHPLTLHRQYLKNVGRNIDFDLQDGSRLTAKLLEVHPEYMLVERLAEKKKNKIKQMQSEGSMQIAFTDIAKALVQISFN